MVGRVVRVLVVEDSPTPASIVRASLEDYKTITFEVTVVSTLAGAVRELPGTGLVVLDLDLPDSSGLETLRRVQALAPSVPIIVFSGHPSSQFAGDCIRAGAQEYICKLDWTVRDVAEKTTSALVRHEVRGQYEPVEEALASIKQTTDTISNLLRGAGTCSG